MTNLAFLLSNWYSGATLLAFLINNHPELVCNGEAFPFRFDPSKAQKYICSCGEQISNCTFYSNTIFFDKNSSVWSDDFSVLPQLSSLGSFNRFLNSMNKLVWLRDMCLADWTPTKQKRLAPFLANHLSFFKLARKFYNAACYVDGTKSVRRLELFLKYTTNEIVAFHLIRDGRGFCYSYLKNNNLPNSHLKTAAQKWDEYIELTDLLSKRFPQLQVTTVRYEDLCSSPIDTLVELCSKLEIDYSEKMLQKIEDHHIFGNRMRNSFAGKIVEDLTWKEKFTSKEIQYLEELLYRNLTRFNYL